MSDLISRQEAITELSSLFWPDPYDACNKNCGHDEHNYAITEAIDEIEGLPSAQPEHKTGRWLEDSGNIACSICHTIWLHRRTDYCPNCGARMVGGA